MERSRILLVAHEGDDDASAIQRASAAERFQRVENHHIAAFHVGTASTRCQGVEPDESLSLSFEHSIEVPDQQQPLPAISSSFSEKMPGATDRVRERDPLGLEAK